MLVLPFWLVAGGGVFCFTRDVLLNGGVIKDVPMLIKGVPMVIKNAPVLIIGVLMLIKDVSVLIKGVLMLIKGVLVMNNDFANRCNLLHGKAK